MSSEDKARVVQRINAQIRQAREMRHDAVREPVAEAEAQPETDDGAGWDLFESQLAGHLSAMVHEATEPGNGDTLVIEIGEGDGLTTYTQFAAFGTHPRMIRAEIAGDCNSYPDRLPDARAGEQMRARGWAGNDPVTEDQGKNNWYLERPIADADQIAAEVTWALRHCFRVTDPAGFDYRAWGQQPVPITQECPHSGPTGCPEGPECGHSWDCGQRPGCAQTHDANSHLISQAHH